MCNYILPYLGKLYLGTGRAAYSAFFRALREGKTGWEEIRRCLKFYLFLTNGDGNDLSI